MTILYIFLLVALVALLSVKKFFSSFLINRISSIAQLFSVVFIITIYIQSIGSGLCFDGGLFQVTSFTHQQCESIALGFSTLNLTSTKNKALTKNKNKPNFKWENISLPIKKGIFLNKQIINTHINQFWSTNIDNISKDLHLLILTRIKFDNGEYSTLGNLQRLNKDDKDYYINYLSSILELNSDHYISTPIIDFTISYGFREGILPNKQFNKDKDIKYLTYYHYKIPLTFDPLKYGPLLAHSGNRYYSQINKTDVALIKVLDPNQNKVLIFKSGILVLEYLDTKIDDSTFKREIGKNTYYITNDKIELVTTQKSVKFINKITKSKSSNNFLTLNTETPSLPSSTTNPCILPFLSRIVRIPMLPVPFAKVESFATGPGTPCVKPAAMGPEREREGYPCNNLSKLNILSLIVVSLIIYRFIRGLSFDIGLLSLIFSFFISFAISNFVLDKFTYSENMFIRFIQRFLIYVLIFIMGLFVFFYILNFFDLVSTIYNCSDEINPNQLRGGAPLNTETISHPSPTPASVRVQWVRAG